MPTLFQIEYENPAEGWWADALENLDTAPEWFRPFLTSQVTQQSAVAPSKEEAAKAVAWCMQWPGWRDPDAPPHARYPLRISQSLDDRGATLSQVLKKDLSGPWL